MGCSAYELELEICGVTFWLGFFSFGAPLGNFSLAISSWDFLLGVLGLGSSAWDLSLGICPSGSFVWVFSCGKLGPGRLGQPVEGSRGSRGGHYGLPGLHEIE